MPIDAEKIIHNYAYQMKSANELNCNTVMKKDRIRITESQLEKVIKDTLKRIQENTKLMSLILSLLIELWTWIGENLTTAI